MTERGAAALLRLEGLREHVYEDAAGLPTIGVGHLLTKAELASGTVWIGPRCLPFQKGLTRVQCMDLLACDVGPTERAVRAAVRVPLAAHQWDALVIFAFNIGLGAFRLSTLLKKLNAGDFASVPTELRRWVYSRGKKVLVSRREAEIRIWNGAEENV